MLTLLPSVIMCTTIRPTKSGGIYSHWSEIQNKTVHVQVFRDIANQLENSSTILTHELSKNFPANYFNAVIEAGPVPQLYSSRFPS